MLRERTGVCAELYLNYPSLWEILSQRVKDIYSNKEEKGISYEPLE